MTMIPKDESEPITATGVADIGEALKAIRVRAGLSQEALGEKLGRTNGVIISRHEQGLSVPSLQTLEARAHATNHDLVIVFMPKPKAKAKR